MGAILRSMHASRTCATYLLRSIASCGDHLFVASSGAPLLTGGVLRHRIVRACVGTICDVNDGRRKGERGQASIHARAGLLQPVQVRVWSPLAPKRPI
jgi:hypothetical protein